MTHEINQKPKIPTIQITVSPGFLDVRARRLRRTSELSSEDLPTLERPTRANSGRPSEGQSSVLTLLLTNSACEIWASLAYLASTIFEPFKILALRLEVALPAEGASVSGGTKSFSSETWTAVSSAGISRFCVGSEVVERLDLIVMGILGFRKRLKWVLQREVGFVRKNDAWNLGSWRSTTISLSVSLTYSLPLCFVSLTSSGREGRLSR